MATLGRVFVLLNGFAALTFLMWSVALFTNRVNWFTDKGGNKENVGLVDKFEGQFKDRNKTAQSAAARYEKNAFGGEGSLASVENERLKRRVFYRDALNRVTLGVDASGKPIPAQVVKIMKRDANNIKLDIVSQLQPYLVGRATLESIVAYTKRIADGRDQLKLQQAEADRLVTAYKGLTEEIFGLPGMKKGLRDLIKEQEAINAGAESGTAYLIPIITERSAQTDIFLERNAVLQDRLTVLGEYLKRRKTSVNRE